MDKYEIEKSAKRIITLLANNGMLTVEQLRRLLNLESTNIILTLGYLVGNEKIRISELGGDLLIESTCSFSNLYY